MQYPVVDLRRVLIFANDASQKQVSVGPVGSAGNLGNSGGSGMGASEKSPSGRSTEGRPLGKLVLWRMPQVRAWRRQVVTLLRFLQCFSDRCAENFAMVVISNPMSGRHVTQAYRSLPSDVLCANPIRFCKALHSLDPLTGPCSLKIMSRTLSGRGDVGRDLISSSPGWSQPCAQITRSMHPGHVISMHYFVRFTSTPLKSLASPRASSGLVW